MLGYSHRIASQATGTKNSLFPSILHPLFLRLRFIYRTMWCGTYLQDISLIYSATQLFSAPLPAIFSASSMVCLFLCTGFGSNSSLMKLLGMIVAKAQKHCKCCMFFVQWSTMVQKSVDDAFYREIMPHFSWEYATVLWIRIGPCSARVLWPIMSIMMFMVTPTSPLSLLLFSKSWFCQNMPKVMASVPRNHTYFATKRGLSFKYPALFQRNSASNSLIYITQQTVSIGISSDG